MILFPSLPPGKILDMCVSPDGLLLCTSSDDKALKIFDVINFGKSLLFITVVKTGLLFYVTVNA